MSVKKLTMNEVASLLRTVPDFPKQGIQFKDITTVLKNPDAFYTLVENLYDMYKDKGITKICCMESRGFILGGALAYKLGAGFVMVRKPNKLPADTYSIDYELEYGTNKLEIHKDAIIESDIVLIHDDLLATGGTANATIELVQKFAPQQIFVNFFIELGFLNGRNNLKRVDGISSLLMIND